MEALSLANEIRSRRSELKADLKAGRVLLADVMLSEAAYLQGMRVRDLLLATPGIGKLKAARALRVCWISHTAPISKTSRASRERLLAWIAANHPVAETGWEGA
jgi:hypothetical protein